MSGGRDAVELAFWRRGARARARFPVRDLDLRSIPAREWKIMKTLCAIWIVLLSAVSGLAADSKPVSYKSGDETVQGVLYTPTGKGPFPALVVIHEWWGLNDWVKDQATKL